MPVFRRLAALVGSGIARMRYTQRLLVNWECRPLRVIPFRLAYAAGSYTTNLPHTISLLERDGFEPSVPRQESRLLRLPVSQTAEGRRSSFPPLGRAGTGKVLGGIARRGGPALHGSARDLLWQSSWHWREAAH